MENIIYEKNNSNGILDNGMAITQLVLEEEIQVQKKK